uniref:TGS domain-containing protein n=1 Tax=Mangrovibacterium sp. TaxID=1961364 RepID=UPI003565DD39
MIKITLPDNSVRDFESGVTGLEIANAISSRLAKDVLAVSVNGEVWDLNRPINQDSAIKLFTWDDREGKET